MKYNGKEVIKHEYWHTTRIKLGKHMGTHASTYKKQSKNLNTEKKRRVHISDKMIWDKTR